MENSKFTKKFFDSLYKFWEEMDDLGDKKSLIEALRKAGFNAKGIDTKEEMANEKRAFKPFLVLHNESIEDCHQTQITTEEEIDQYLSGGYEYDDLGEGFIIIYL